MSPDSQLLGQFVQDGSEPAFAELVRRHVDHVYSAALRQLEGDTHRARDVTQVVFGELLRQASRLQRHPSLGGWLHLTATHLAARTRRTEQRRTRREQAALVMSDPPSTAAAAGEDASWHELRPLLDDALRALPELDRELIVLRFFRGLPFAEVGRPFGIAENSARMRVERALERLRRQLARRGVTSTAALLAGTLGSHAVVPAPAGLAASLTPALLGAATLLPGLLPASGGWARVLDSLLFAKKWLLTGSVGALVVALAPGFPSELGSKASRVQVTFAPRTAPVPEAGPAPDGPPEAGWDWASVEASDYRDLIANLRASGAPEGLIRDFVALDLELHYARRAKESGLGGAPTPYWRKPTAPAPDAEALGRRKELDRERVAVLQSLLGPGVRPRDAWSVANVAPDHDAVRFAWLPVEVRDRALAILQPSLDEETEENSRPGVRVLEPEVERRRLESRVAALREVLTPEQLEEFRLREDRSYEDVRARVQYCELTPDEFRRLAGMRESLFHRPAVTLADQRALEQEVTPILGVEKSREFVRGLDFTYIYARRVAESLGQSDDVAGRIWEIKRQAMADAEALASRRGVVGAEQTRQRQEIVERAARDMKGLVGDEGFKALQADWPFWSNLRNPGAVPSNRKTR